MVAPRQPAFFAPGKGSLPLCQGPFRTAGTGADSGARPLRREAPFRIPEAQLEPVAFARIASRSIFGQPPTQFPQIKEGVQCCGRLTFGAPSEHHWGAHALIGRDLLMSSVVAKTVTSVHSPTICGP